MKSPSSSWIDAGTLTELKEKKSKVISGGIAVFYHEQEVFAVDNRCPHMGFPLHTGTLCDGMLTCHWHHARFDVCSGGTLDPWADDVPVYEVRVDQDRVLVCGTPKTMRNEEKLFQRLRDGLQQNISLVIAKSVVSLVKAGVSETKIAQVGVEFGVQHRSSGWGSGLTVLSAMLNIMPKLDQYGRILALFHGLRSVASDAAGSSPRFLLQPLPDSKLSLDRLTAWYRQCVEVRDTQGAERVLLTAIEHGVTLDKLQELMLSAVTDHFYLDGGHTYDFHNKAFEVLEHIGSEHVKHTLSALVPLLRNPSRSEESHNWQHPVNLVKPLWEAFERLQSVTSSPINQQYSFDESAFLEQLLHDDPLQTVAMLTDLLSKGASAVTIARLIALAAAERIVSFHTQNDFADWNAVLHTYTHAHAVHASLLRDDDPSPNLLRALYYSAMRIYLDRFLNIPKAKRPDPAQYNKRGYTTDLEQFLEILDERQQVQEAGNWVYHYIDQNEDMPALFNTMAHALLREDANFHTFQMLEAALMEHDQWEREGSELANAAKRTTVLALARYLSAHAPTSRERSHVARIAWRLQQGEELFEE